MELPYDRLIKPQIRHFVNYCLTGGSHIKYIPTDIHTSNWPGWCNPSIIWDDANQEFKLNLRNVNHLMSNSPNIWALEHRLLYSVVKEDGRNLKTRNWIGTCKDPFNEDFELKLIKTNEYTPQWEFQGHEDGRLVLWNDILYSTGVRRDDNTTGRGRMELMRLERNGDGWSQARTIKISGPKQDSTYCEKNWMPIKDIPFHWMRIGNPTTICKANESGDIEDVIIKPHHKCILDQWDMVRGSSQVIPWKDGHIALVHMCEMWWTANDRKVAKYIHAFIEWDKDWNIKRITPTFSFADFDIEFSCGLEWKDGIFYIPFAIHDNVPFLLMMPEDLMDRFLNGYIGIGQMTDTIPFPVIPDNCLLLKLNATHEELRRDAFESRKNGKMAKAYTLFLRAFDKYHEIDHTLAYEDLFYAARCVADLGNRDDQERSLWYHVLEFDDSRPEGALALAMYYSWRWDNTAAQYWCKKAVKLLKSYTGNLIFYKEDDFHSGLDRTTAQTKDYAGTRWLGVKKQDRRAF